MQGNEATLAEQMQAVYVAHYAEWGPSGERMVIYVGEDDLDAWIAEARALQAEREASAAILAAAEAYGAAHREYAAATAVLAKTPYTTAALSAGNLRYLRAGDAQMAANETLLALLAARG